MIMARTAGKLMKRVIWLLWIWIFLLGAENSSAGTSGGLYDMSRMLNQPHPFSHTSPPLPVDASKKEPAPANPKSATPMRSVMESSSKKPVMSKGGIFDIFRSAEVTLDVGYYKYEEPNFMSDTSDPVFISLGLRNWEVSTDAKNPWHFLYTAEITRGWVHYSGSGELDKDYYKFRGEAYAGYSFGAFTPLIGLGYRWLYDDSGGEISSTGLRAYDRRSQYLYIPIGGIFVLNEKLKIKGQFNYFLAGRQKSYLSDVAGSDVDENDQSSGWGTDVTIDYRFKDKISLYSYFRYWDVDRSNTVSGTHAGALSFQTYEPDNTTVELGVGLAYKF